jgi:hypothetical protein
MTFKKIDVAKAALRQQRAADGVAATSEYKAAQKAEQAKTVRLKALRLARDTAAKTEKAAAPKTPSKVKR